MFCPKCGAENPNSNAFCWRCGVDLGRLSPMAGQDNKNWAIVALACAVGSLICLPIVLGPLGIALAIVYMTKEKRVSALGIGLVIVSVVFMVIGVIVGALSWNR